MSRLIDADRLKEVFNRNVAGGNAYFDLIDNAPTVEAILKADYENRLKADLVAMLTDIQMEIEEHEESIIGRYGKGTKESDFPSHEIERNNGREECVELIQQKIDKLKETEQ